MADTETHLPTDSDVSGAMEALARIQTTYNLSVDDLASGKIAGHTALLPLSRQTVFDIAVQCLSRGRPDVALEWLEHIRRNTSTTADRSVIPPSSLYQAYARAFAQVSAPRDIGMTDMSKKKTKKN